jgi:hypothetical protein
VYEYVCFYRVSKKRQGRNEKNDREEMGITARFLGRRIFVLSVSNDGRSSLIGG